MIDVGAVAPDFELVSHLADKKFALSQFKGEKNVVLLFYPLDWSPNCSQEIPAFQALKGDFDAADTQLLGISVDSRFSHNSWAASLGGVSFPLLADFHPKGEVGRSFGLYLEAAGICDRATVIIDKEGIVQYAVSVGPPGLRDASAILGECRKING